MKPHFATPVALHVDLKVDGRFYVSSEIRYWSKLLGMWIVIPVGFLTDLASVPRVPFAYWLVGGKANAAAVVHDFLCKYKIVPREKADAVFLEVAEITKVVAWRRKTMHAGVRAYAIITGKDGATKAPAKDDVYSGGA